MGVAERRPASTTRPAPPDRPRVLFVTGAYYPEISAAGVQCRAAAAALCDRIHVSVLTTAVTRSLPLVDIVDEAVVYRVPIDVRSPLSRASASIRLLRSMMKASRGCDVVHLHGVSQKNVPVTAVARLLRKPVVLTLHTAGQDEPEAVRRSGWMAERAFASADLILSVSPCLTAKCVESGMSSERIRPAPNGVDTHRFRPADRSEQLELRRVLGWPDAQPVVLFTGFFSRDKRPDLLFRAWRRLPPGLRVRLVYVGATGAGYYEIDGSLARQIRSEAARIGRADDVVFVDPTNQIDQYFQAADVFVLPSVREAHPLALLEAMACGLPSVATRLPGATDVLIEDGMNGRLFPADDEMALCEVLRDVLADRPAAWLIGARARDTIIRQYDVRRTSEQWLAAYEAVIRKNISS